MDIRQAIIIISILVFCFALGKASFVGAAEPNQVFINLDKQAIVSGFTVKSLTKQLWIPIFPNQFKTPVSVFLKEESAPGNLPQNTKPVSAFYNYEVKSQTLESNNLLLSFASDSFSGFNKSVYIYNKVKDKWIKLPTKIVDSKKNILQANVSVQSGHAVVLETIPEKWTSAAAVVIDRKTGKQLYEKDAGEVRSIASLTKLMTALVFLENKPKWDTVVTMKSTDFVGGSTLLVNAGDKLTVKDLFNATLIGSKNNAVSALVRSTGLTEKQFVAAMNEKAKSLGLMKTKFVEPTGLDSRNVSTASELAIIAKKAFENRDIATATTKEFYQVKTINNGKLIWVKSTSKTILDRDLDIVGTKTGVIDQSGYNLVTSAKKGDHELIALVLGAEQMMNYEEVYFLLKKHL